MDLTTCVIGQSLGELRTKLMVEVMESLNPKLGVNVIKRLMRKGKQ